MGFLSARLPHSSATTACCPGVSTAWVTPGLFLWSQMTREVTSPRDILSCAPIHLPCLVLWPSSLASSLKGRNGCTKAAGSSPGTRGWHISWCPELGVVLHVGGCGCCELRLKILSIKCLKEKKTVRNSLFEKKIHEELWGFVALPSTTSVFQHRNVTVLWHTVCRANYEMLQPRQKASVSKQSRALMKNIWCILI